MSRTAGGLPTPPFDRSTSNAADTTTADGDFARTTDAVDDALPQTQCTRCGYPDCRRYAEAIVHDGAPINQCPPGGAEGIARLARITGRPVWPLNPVNGVESPRKVALIDEAWCIGCTLCLKACPVDSIVGGPKSMHTVVGAQCTGCELCLPACPVDCISMVATGSSATGRADWSPAQADQARDRYRFHRFREKRDEIDRQARLAAAAIAIGTPGRAAADRPFPTGPGHPDKPDPPDKPEKPDKRATILAAMARAKAVRAG